MTPGIQPLLQSWFGMRQIDIGHPKAGKPQLTGFIAQPGQPVSHAGIVGKAV